MRCAVILNPGARGAADAEERVRRALAAAGLSAEIACVRGAGCAEAARRAAADPSVDAVIAAGGDGTVSAVAASLAGSDKPLGVLPLGTLNHFAKDLGIPMDLDEAVRIVARGAVRRVDLGEVNERVFVNNSSVGLYPRAVRMRDRVKRRVGKWVAMIWGSAIALVRLAPMVLRIVWDGGALPRRTPFVFVGNNRYETALLAGQRRPALDEGKLGVYVAREGTRLGLLTLGLRALVNRVDAARHLDALEVPQVSIQSHRRTLQVAVDGEVLRLAPPIRYRIRPGALRVLAPAPA